MTTRVAEAIAIAAATVTVACTNAGPGANGIDTEVGTTLVAPDDTSTGPGESGEPDTTHGDPDDTTGPTPTTDTGDDDDADHGVPGAWCTAIPECVAPLPDPGPTIPWQVGESTFVVASGGPNHRGRDMFYNEGEAQWVLAKFAYGPSDWDLEGERVDMFVLRDCTGDWESLGTTMTTFEGDHPTIEGVADTGGRVYMQIPAAQTLGPGRHRIHFVVRGDLTRADMFIEVVPPGTPIFVADVDGTLTTSETEEFGALLTGSIPEVNPGAPEALAQLVERGYHPMYLTARPEFLGARTHEFVRMRGLPPGIVHTTLNFDGALGSAAVQYKTQELAALAARGLVPDFVFGNTDSDAEAYQTAGIQPLLHRIFYRYDDAFGGRTIQAYADLFADFGALPDLCAE